MSQTDELVAKIVYEFGFSRELHSTVGGNQPRSTNQLAALLRVGGDRRSRLPRPGAPDPPLRGPALPCSRSVPAAAKPVVGPDDAAPERRLGRKLRPWELR